MFDVFYALHFMRCISCVAFHALHFMCCISCVAFRALRCLRICYCTFLLCLLLHLLLQSVPMLVHSPLQLLLYSLLHPLLQLLLHPILHLFLHLSLHVFFVTDSQMEHNLNCIGYVALHASHCTRLHRMRCIAPITLILLHCVEHRHYPFVTQTKNRLCN